MKMRAPLPASLTALPRPHCRRRRVIFVVVDQFLCRSIWQKRKFLLACCSTMPPVALPVPVAAVVPSGRRWLPSKCNLWLCMFTHVLHCVLAALASALHSQAHFGQCRVCVAFVELSRSMQCSSQLNNIAMHRLSQSCRVCRLCRVMSDHILRAAAVF